MGCVLACVAVDCSLLRRDDMCVYVSDLDPIGKEESRFLEDVWDSGKSPVCCDVSFDVDQTRRNLSTNCFKWSH
jgi:hypothetical protein